MQFLSLLNRLMPAYPPLNRHDLEMVRVLLDYAGGEPIRRLRGRVQDRVEWFLGTTHRRRWPNTTFVEAYRKSHPNTDQDLGLRYVELSYR